MALATLVGGVRLSTFAPDFVYAMWRLLCGRAPDALHPLLLSNCDGELFAAALKTAVEPAISSWALAAQRGFSMLPQTVASVEVCSAILRVQPHP